jgi:hypothetical protein
VDEPMIGRELKQFRIIKAIGSGGMGEVYRAHDTKLDRDVALKVLPQGSLADENARKRFRKEAHALSRLSHPHIASLFDFDTTEDGTDFLVMELVTGPSLDMKLLRGPLLEKEVVRLGAQILRCLVAAHERRIIHRDLKPQNIRLTSDGLVKVLDFGLARVAPAPGQRDTTDTASGSVAGTPPYMSPEQLLGKEVDARTDVYAAGVVLYEMATGRRPFGEASGPQLVAKILNEPMLPPRELNPALSPQLEQVILKAADKDKELRYQTAKELLVDLDRLAAGTAPAAAASPATNRETPVIVSARPGGRVRRWLWLGAALAALVGVLGAATLWLLRPGEPRITATRSLVHANVTGMETDGANVYYTVRDQQLFANRLMTVPLGGGLPRQIPIPWNSDLMLWGLRRDPPELLLTRGTELWRLPLTQGAPTRFEGLPPINAEDGLSGAAWSPRGDRLAWIEDREDSQVVWVGDAQGRNGRRVAEVPKAGHSGASVSLQGWHPSGQWFRYNTRERAAFDVGADGDNQRKVDQELPADVWSVAPAWTRDGAFFLQGSRRGVLAHAERAFLPWRPKPRAPVHLGGPTHVSRIRVTPDGQQVVAFVYRVGVEVVRLGRSSGTPEPLFPDGTRAWALAYSPDGSRVAWVGENWPGRLWVSHPDGTDRLPLGDVDVHPLMPLAWSSDGRRIAFTSSGLRLYVASPGDGTVEPLTAEDAGRNQFDPCWSRDGRWLAYSLGHNDPIAPAEFYLRRVDLETRTVTKLEGSEGLWGPKCAADGRILASDRAAEGEYAKAQASSLTRRIFFKIRDPQTGLWTPLTIDLLPGPRPSSDQLERADLFFPTWSHDGRHLYAYQAPQRRVVRFSVPGGRLETVAQPSGFEQLSLWFTLDPHDAPLLHRDVTQREIVVMDLEVR